MRGQIAEGGRGEIEVRQRITGAGLAVVTVTLTEDGGPAGALTVIWLAVLVRIVAELLPNFTEVAPARLLPLRVTTFPPEVGPEVGLRLLRTGTEAAA